MQSKNIARNEDPVKYAVDPSPATDSEDEIIAMALGILSKRMRTGECLNSPNLVSDYLKLRLDGLEHEVFGVVFFDAQNRVIQAEELFRGTLTQTSVYPREVVKEALKLNAASAIFYHNHPSGVATPSNADRHITEALKNALSMVDVKSLDHIIVAGGTSVSFAERGYM